MARTASSDSASVGVTNLKEKVHRSVHSISSSLKDGSILTSDALGKVALWEAVQGGKGNEETDIEHGKEPDRNLWTLKLLRSRNSSENNNRVELTGSRSIRQRAPTCHVTQIHPSRPFFAATGDKAGASLYKCPLEGDDSESFGVPIKYITDDTKATRRGQGEKGNRPFGQSLTFHPSGSTLAVGSNKGVVSIFDIETSSTMAILQNHSDTIRALEFTKTGELLVGSDQGSVTMYDLRARESGALQSGSQDLRSKNSHTLDFAYIDTLKGHKSWVTSVKVSPDPNYVASSSFDGHVKIWDLRMEPNRSVAIFQTKEEMPVWSLSWKPNADASSFVTGNGGMRKDSGNTSNPTAIGNVRWYQISGSI
ncbi:hypothetical protein CBS101457_000988 [Exobasidium rhododendri]|nr:hypothetical protein CBS101457_000988 [Exobasidium rhododendri]